MRVVSIGDLVTDYYYKNEKILGINGGMTSHNIIANLAKMGINTAVFGTCGNDMQGEIAIKSLEKLDVDTNNIVVLDDVRTRCFHVSYFDNEDKLSFTSKKRCPFCNNKKWYEDSLIDIDDIIKKINNDDILVFDNLNSKNQEIIDNTDTKKIIDIGYFKEFEKLSDEELINKIRYKFEIINFNERVANYLLKRFNLTDDFGIYCLFNPKFMTITRGEKGATFIYDNAVYNFKLTNIGNTVDPSGAGDTFISSIIKNWIKNNYEFDPKLFKKWYENSTKLTSEVVSKMGARSHIYSLYEVKCTDKCSCDEISLIKNKQLTR